MLQKMRQALGVFRIGLLSREARFQGNGKPATLTGAYVMGLAFAFGWTPCIGPILAAILSVAASIEYSLAIPNFQILEHSHHAHKTKGLIASNYPEPVDGVFPATDVPGLGVEIDEEAVEKYSVE